ncbi:MAG TPA: alpha/beta fold hydrolase [Chitinophagales bacterium]|nr:alpha/beta fold hydrolase [Chitinophagales bacterium]
MQLNFKKFGEGFPVIILHGLLGSLDNWQTIAKKLAETPFAVYIIDQRNHGKSPHSDEFSYDLLANDLLEFFQQQQITKAHLIGHSMGGKTVMKFALEHPEMVDKLVVVDVAPVAYDDRHSNVFAALFAADIANAKTREEVEEVLRHKLDNDETTVQFLMKGLHRGEDNAFEWKFNLEALHKAYTEISSGVTHLTPFNGQTLFIKGQRSSYITGDNYSTIEHLFPNNELAEIKGAGHWVHAEKPQEFLSELNRFLGK